MAFSTTSYFAGVGTVFAAITLGFACGAMIMSGPKVEPPNRLQRVTSSAPLPSPTLQTVVSKPEPQQPPSELAYTSDTLPSVQQPVVQQPTLTPSAPPIVAKDEDVSAKVDYVKVRAAELKKTPLRKKVVERKFVERNKRQA